MKFEQGNIVVLKGHSRKPMRVRGYNGAGMVLVESTDKSIVLNQRVFVEESLRKVASHMPDACNCDAMYDCCDCGGNDCGCGYCFSCNACEDCLNED